MSAAGKPHSNSGDSSQSGDLQPRQFRTTRWSMVVAAADQQSPEQSPALAQLCESYWYPLYAFARRQGHAAEDAQDLTQGFFATLLEKSFLATADSDRGRFRTFLLTAFKRFAANQRARDQATKRGGGALHLSIDFPNGEDRYQFEPADQHQPEDVFERRWALTLLDRALVELKRSYEESGRVHQFELLKGFLTGDADTSEYDRVAQELNSSPGSVRVAVHRLREKYRLAVRQQIAETVESPDEIEDELQHLTQALRIGNSAQVATDSSPD